MSGRVHSEHPAPCCCSDTMGNNCLWVSAEMYVSTAMYMPQPVVPTVDPSQLAAQQQAFINQQAMLMVSGRDWVGEALELEKNALVYVLQRG